MEGPHTLVTLALETQCEEEPVVVSQTDLVAPVSVKPIDGVEPRSESQTLGVEQLSGEAVQAQILGSVQKQPSVDGEVVVDGEGGSALGVEDVELSVQAISSNEPRTNMSEATQTDTTLATARALADKLVEGYYWIEGLVFRTRLDRLGDNQEQLCLPTKYRGRCLTLAHELFGHPGRNKMGDHIRCFFYRPSITADCIRHIKSCLVCLRKDRTNPKPMTMQEREVVTVPSERVAVDIVGPFPTAKGGYRFPLTYIDLAMRWLEAIPLRTTTTRVIIDQLTVIFSRCGFPSTLVWDNGPQFVA